MIYFSIFWSILLGLVCFLVDNTYLRESVFIFNSGGVSNFSGFLGHLHFIHNGFDPAIWEHRLKLCAKEYNLSTDAIDFALEYKRGQYHAD